MSSKQWFSTLLLFGIAFSLARAQDKGQDRGTEKQSDPASNVSREAYVIERVYTRISGENDGTGTRESEAEIRMLADAGVKAFAVLNFTYTSANEVVEIDYVRVRKPDGTVVKTPDYNIQDMPGEITRTAPLYSDIHEKHVAVKGLSVGDVLEYLVRYRVTKPEVPGHFWQEYSFTKNAIARDERLEISVPAAKYVKVVSPEFKPEVKEEGGRRIYRWTHTNLIVREKDPDEIPRRIPPNPDVQVTTFTNWEEVGNWYGELQKTQLEVTPTIQSKVNELTKGLKTDEEKIRAIYNFVSLKFHYIGLDFGIGRYQPHAADDVLDNGYGDCKDKHTLLAALLKAAGMEAWPALIHGSRKLDPNVPSPAQFNHVITVVRSGGENIWLDTTPEVAPYGLLLMVLRDKQALVIPAQKPPLLMTTAANPPFPQQQEFSMSGKLDGSGTFSGHVEQSYRGDTEVLLRGAFRQVPESQWTSVVQRFSYGLNFGGDVSNVKVTPPDDIDKPFEISYDYLRKKYGDWDNRQITPPLPPMGVEVAKDAKERKLLEPMFLGALGKINYRSRLELPEGYTVTAPAKVHLTEPYAEYSSVTTIADGAMTTNREMVIKKNEVALTDWEGFRKFGRAVYDDEFNFLRLEGSGSGMDAKAEEEKDKDMDADEMFGEGTSAMQRRDFRSAQNWFEKVIAKNPQHKGAHFALGGALMAQGHMEDGLAELRKEQDVSPDDERSYLVPATFFTRMNRRDEAIAEWRKLLKVNPKNTAAATTLGGLLYQEQKYDDAAGVLEAAAKESPDDAGLRYSLGQAYLKTGQQDKALAQMRAAVEKKSDDPMMLNNVAYTLAETKSSLDLAQQYAESSVAKLEQRMKDAESSHDLRSTFHRTGLSVTFQLSLTWDTLGWVYYQQGDAKRAEPFVRAAWLLGEHDVVGEHLGEIYEKEGRTQEAARAYQFALSVSSVPISTFGVPGDSAKEYRSHSDALKARYKKLTGKDPSLMETRRLPNGEWTQTPAEQLRHAREIKVPNDSKLSGTGQFIVVLRPGQVESAEYESGEEDLKVLAGKLKAAHFPLEFPPASGAILTLRVDVSCKPAAPCIASLVNPVPETPPAATIPY